MQTDLCIVIPAYQPAQTLPQYVRDLRRALDCCVLVVDDGSDGYIHLYTTRKMPLSCGFQTS